MLPVKGFKMTRRFGVPGPYSCGHHEGVDYGCPVGTPVVAAADGLVVATGAPWGNAFGHDSPLIRHSVTINGAPHTVWAIYAHMSHCAVKPGEHVKKGQVIGLSGAEGHVTGPHVHFEMQMTREWHSGGGRNPYWLLKS